MNHFPEALQALFSARRRNAARQPGDAEMASGKDARRFHRAASARRRLAATGGLLGSLGLVAGMLQIAGTLPAAAATGVSLFAAPTNQGTHDCLSAANACTLATALATANADTSDTINLAAGTYPTVAYSITSSQTWTGASQSGTIINGGAPPVTVAASTTVALNTLTIKSGTTGGIANSGTLSLTSVTVTGNTGGSGIKNVTSASSLALTGSTVSSNTTATKGGGIDNLGTVTTGVSASTISGNIATGNGGGIDNESGATLTTTGLVVTANSSGAAGGGIANEPGALALSLTGGTIGGASAPGANTATTNGGGVANLVTTISPLATLSGVNVAFNTSTALGGGIYSVGPLSVTGGSISNNTATTAGGGLYTNAITPASPPTLTGVTVNANQTGTTGGGIADVGGGLVMTSGSLSNNFTTAAGTDGGGAWISTTPTNNNDTFSGVTISGNTAQVSGGGIAVVTDGGLVLNASGGTATTVSGNIATTVDGGGLFLNSAASATCNVSLPPPGGPSAIPPTSSNNFCVEAGTVISGNSAPGGSGGGISLEGGVLQITNSTVGSGNFALTKGGGIADGPTAGENMSIVNSTITGNSVQSATGSGGGIYGGFGTSPFSIIYDSTIANNSIPNAVAGGTGNGAGLFNNFGFTLTNDTIYGNGSASFGGGIFNGVTGKLVMTNLTFSSNSVKTSLGGAAFWGVTTDTSSSLGSIFSGDADFTASGTVQDECGGTGSGTANTPPASVGYNLDAEHTCGFAAAGDQTGSNTAALQGLASNGGPTQTDALGGTSTAINGDGIGNSAVCPTVDERGSARNGVARGKCDIGAYDTGGNGAGLTATTTTASVLPTSVAAGATVTYSATVAGGTTPTGTVSFTAAGTATCTATLSGGTGSCTATNAPAGTDTVVGTYSGDGGHSGSIGSTTLTVTGATVVPGAPSGLSATAGNGSATFIWTAPTTGSAPTSYTVTCSPSGVATVTGTPPVTNTTISSLTNGTLYTCSVTATNSAGTGAASTSTTVTPTSTVTIPGKPTGLIATPGDGLANFAWSPPSTGGAPTSYTVTCVPSGSTVVSATNATISGLTNGTTYTCTVTASNSAGSGPASAAISVTPVSGTPPPSHGPCVNAGYTGNSAFICQLYLDLLGRMPDAGGLATWNAALNGGMSRTQAALSIATSTEYRTDFIQGDYQAFLGRSVDGGGLSTWLGAFNAGATDEQVDAGILGSPEFFIDSGSNNNSFINAVYQVLLGRSADPSGLATWNAALSGGMSRTQVALSIDTSQESRMDIVELYYQTLLGRSADPGGMSTWLGALNSGSTDEGVLAGIAGSNEFFAVANR